MKNIQTFEQFSTNEMFMTGIPTNPKTGTTLDLMGSIDNTNKDMSEIIQKYKKKIENLPIFQKAIDSIFSEMTPSNVKKLISTFNLVQGKEAPSIQAIMAKVQSIMPEEMNEKLDEKSVFNRIVFTIKTICGANMALMGVPGALISVLTGWFWGGMAITWITSFIASVIIHWLCCKILKMDYKDDTLL
jgi:hypothetical protein